MMDPEAWDHMECQHVEEVRGDHLSGSHGCCVSEQAERSLEDQQEPDLDYRVLQTDFHKEMHN